MKGLIVFALSCLFSFAVSALEVMRPPEAISSIIMRPPESFALRGFRPPDGITLKSHKVTSLKTLDGKIISNLSLQEGSKLLESLEAGENIELREVVIYPEEVSEVHLSKLTKPKFVEKKRPNPKDYN